MAVEQPKKLEAALAALRDPSERFLARVLDATLSRGFRSADDFVGHFTADAVMRALEDAPPLRVRILAEGVGIPKKIAERCSTAAAAEDLQIALEEGVTDAETVLRLFPLTDRVARLPAAELWRFCAHGWSEGASATQRLAVILEAALAENLIGLSDVATLTRLEALAARLPAQELRRAYALAAESAMVNRPVRQDAVAKLVDVRALIEGADRDELWENVVLDLIARPAGLLSTRLPSPVRERNALPSVPRLRIVPPTEDVTIEVRDEELEDASDPQFDLVVPRGRSQSAPNPAPMRSDPDRARRVALTDALREIGRLPRNHEYLSLSILRSIAKMYREMKNHRSKAGRAQAVRDSFDNDAHLRVGLLAVIELIDPDLDAGRVREAGTDALVDIVLAQERALWQKAKTRGSVRPGAEPLRGRLPPPPTRR